MGKFVMLAPQRCTPSCGVGLSLLSELPDYRLQTTIPGVGPINAMTILAEAGDLRRFRDHRQFLKFCGMDLATVQSGMFPGQSKISKYGSARLRRVLWRAGQTSVLQRANSFRHKFERYMFHPGWSHIPSALRIFHGTFGYEGHSTVLSQRFWLV